MTHNELLETARTVLEGGADWEATLAELRRLGASPIASIKVVRELKGISLGEAKDAVHFSRAWADRRVIHEGLHAHAEEDLRSPYESMFDAGDIVRIEKRELLERFRAEWKFHHPLSESQMSYAERTTTVSKVGFYHGGDALYELDGVPGFWHEVNLKTT